jgi:nifR3 family TIM-barrel protein
MYHTASYINDKSKYYWYDEERPLLVQFIGSRVDEFKTCVQGLKNCDLVDLNAGCPSPDQVKAGNGAALLKDLPLLAKIVKVMVKHSPVPVSVKIRMGWDSDEAVKISETLDGLGLDFITVHPRTRFQGYGTPADWSVIRKVKEAVKTPIVASGDLLTPQNVKDCFDITGCEAVMIARGAINNPFIFKDSVHFLKTGELLEHTEVERLDLIIRFMELYHKYDVHNLSELRNHCAWLVKGVKGARKLRDSIGKSKTEQEIKDLITDRKKLY